MAKEKSKDKETLKKEEKDPIKKEKIGQAGFEKEVLEMAKKGLTSEKIGEQLRKQGIHPKDYNKKISKILKENSAYVQPDLKNIEEKLVKIREHYEKNKQDKRAMRERDRIAAKVRKTKKHLKIQ